MTEDGLRGPVGERFSQALAVAGERLDLDVAGLDRVTDRVGSTTWIDQEWRGRRLQVAVATYGRPARSTGYRWIVVRIETRVRLGVWADPVMRSQDPRVGVGLPVGRQPVSPRGVWADEPSLAEDLGSFAATMAEGAVVLQARNDCVLWQLQPAALDGERLAEAITLLGRVADYAETHDAALSARLGRAPGVAGWRLAEIVVVLFVLGCILAMMTGVLVLPSIF